MAGDRRGLLRGPIRALFEAGTVTGLTDGQLLERFATRRGEASELAFAALVERHGPMVLRACRSVLGDHHEAMDAFQATFLVLARKGGSLWVRDSLGPWLHRVALRAAGRAKKAAARRRAGERKAVAMVETRNIDADDRDELAAIINQEVDRLPERYRAAVVLCDLEGRTHEDAARHLGCPVGTVASRLSRGRDRLRDRLTRRGLATALLTWKAPLEPLPPELVTATVAAAACFASTQAASQGLAAILALGVLRSMNMTSWLKAASLLLAVTASTSGVVSLAGKGAGDGPGEPADPPQAAQADAGPTVEVKSGGLSLVVDGPGRLEVTQSSDVYSKIEGQTTILTILPEGTRVVKGQLVSELDSAVLRDSLINQRIAIQGADAAYQQAKLAREVAEIALNEYTQGVYPSERVSALGAVHEEEESIKQAEARLKRTQSARERLNAIQSGRKAETAADVAAELDVADRLSDAQRALPRHRLALENAQHKLDVLEKFTRERTEKQRRIEIGEARVVEAAKRDALALEKARGDKIERQITDCKLYAPNTGMVVYANDPNRTAGRPTPQIEEGATVRERQKIFSLPDLDGPMRVVAKIHESRVERISPGQAVQIKVDAFPYETFKGVVEDVAPLPDPVNMTAGFVKVYTTRVSIARKIPGLRPGMTAQVKILVAALDDVIGVPVGAVVRYDDEDHVAVKTPDGKIDWREVTLGLSTEKDVEVKSGLKSGESVVLDPAPLLSDEQRRKATIPQPPAGPTDASEAKAKSGVFPSPSVRAKMRGIPREDRAKLRNASPEEREAILKKGGLSDDEVRQMSEMLRRLEAPRSPD